MLKKYKNYIFIFISIIIFSLIILLLLKNISKNEIVRIATCPTFYSNLSQLNSDINYSVILTPSTSASLAMLENNEVDYALGGRVLMPGETSFPFEVLGEGFSFLSDKTKSIYDYNLSAYTIYSDLNIDLLKANFGDLDYQIVDNVYEHLDDNLIISSWENTDYSRAEIVHLLRVDDSRNIKSRLPIVFCQDVCSYDVIENIRNVIN